MNWGRKGGLTGEGGREGGVLWMRAVMGGCEDGIHFLIYLLRWALSMAIGIKSGDPSPVSRMRFEVFKWDWLGTALSMYIHRSKKRFVLSV